MTLIALTLACSSGPPEEADATEAVLADYEAAVMETHDAVDAFAVDAAAADWEEHGPIHATYEEDVHHGFEDLEHSIEELAGCEGDAGDALSDAQARLDAMMGYVEGLEALHAEHDNAADCNAAIEDHELEMDEEVDALEAHHDTFHDAMMCEMHDDDEAH